MAYHVRLALSEETPLSADFDYDGGLAGGGRARLDKTCGAVTRIDGEQARDGVFRCAEVTIVRAWRAGWLPERMEFAA